jgi:hypothetical protein
MANQGPGHGLGLRGTTSGNRNVGNALSAKRFFRVQMLVCFRKQFLDAFAIAAVNSDAYACGKPRCFLIFGHQLADAAGDALGFLFLRLRKDESELIAAIARRSVNGAAMNAQELRSAAKGAASDQVTEGIVDLFQVIEIEEKHSKRPAIAIRALGFAFENIEQTPVIG